MNANTARKTGKAISMGALLTAGLVAGIATAPHASTTDSQPTVTVTPTVTVGWSADMDSTRQAIELAQDIRRGNTSPGYSVGLLSSPANVRVTAWDQTESILIVPQGGDNWAWVTQCRAAEASDGSWADCDTGDDPSGAGSETDAVNAALTFLKN